MRIDLCSWNRYSGKEVLFHVVTMFLHKMSHTLLIRYYANSCWNLALFLA